jgi:hypothetical protein
LKWFLWFYNLKKNHFHILFTAKFGEIFLQIDQHFSYIENLKEKHSYGYDMNTGIL